MDLIHMDTTLNCELNLARPPPPREGMEEQELQHLDENRSAQQNLFSWAPKRKWKIAGMGKGKGKGERESKVACLLLMTHLPHCTRHISTMNHFANVLSCQSSI